MEFGLVGGSYQSEALGADALRCRRPAISPPFKGGAPLATGFGVLFIDPVLTAAIRAGSEIGLLRTRRAQYAMVSTVGDLFLSCRPTAISQAVIAIVIDALQSHSWWPRSHIIAERDIAVFPAFTYGDATASVITKIRGLWSAASPDHRAPDAVDLSLPLTMMLAGTRF